MMTTTTDEHRRASYLLSNFYEQLVEHVFISEVLQEVWFRHGETVEVLRSEIDSAGYDVVMECNGVLRHIQLKTSRANASTSQQKVNVALADKPGGCMVWLVRHEDRERGRVELGYRFFGSPAGEPLPVLAEFRVARHVKANARGEKKKRPAIRVIPKGRFEELGGVGELVERLFGLDSN